MRPATTAICIGLFYTYLFAGNGVETTCRYRLEYRPEPAPGAWIVTLDLRGLPRVDGSPALLLENWGEWTEVDDYVTALEGTPSIKRVGNTDRFELVRPGSWMGRLRLRYTIPIEAHGSVVDLLSDLIVRGRYSLDMLRSWLEEREAGDLWSDLVAGGETWPDLESVLWSHGFFSELEVTPTSWTYLGIRTDEQTVPATAVAIDPLGPAAGTPLKVGDRIVGCSPPPRRRVPRGTLLRPEARRSFLPVSRRHPEKAGGEK